MSFPRSRRPSAPWLASLVSSLLLLGCGATLPADRPGAVPTVVTAPRPAVVPTKRVVLVTLDGVRWQDVFYGVDEELGKDLAESERGTADELLPNLYRRLLPTGVAVGAPGHGAPFETGGANVSLPGYLEILAGGRPADCTTNECQGAQGPTLLDEVRGALGTRDEDVALIGSWEKLERAGTTTDSHVVVSAGRTGGGHKRTPLERLPAIAPLLRAGEGCGPAPGTGDYRNDACTAELALAYLEDQAPRFLHVGLGDTDEYAHASDYRSYLAALRRQDAFLGRLLDSLEKTGRRADTTVLVTADHGRSHGFDSHGTSHPESSRVWLFAGGGAVAPARTGYAETTKRATLTSIAPTVRVLLGLPQRTGSAALDIVSPVDQMAHHPPDGAGDAGDTFSPPAPGDAERWARAHVARGRAPRPR
jgi:hypothetical protein